MARKIFIDTEFTDFLDCHLISLGNIVVKNRFVNSIDHAEFRTGINE